MTLYACAGPVSDEPADPLYASTPVAAETSVGDTSMNEGRDAVLSFDRRIQRLDDGVYLLEEGDKVYIFRYSD